MSAFLSILILKLKSVLSRLKQTPNCIGKKSLFVVWCHEFCYMFLLFRNNFPASFLRIFLLMKVWILPTTMLVQWFAWEYPFLTSEVPKSISRWNIMTWDTTKKRQSWQGRNGTKFKLFVLWTRYDYSWLFIILQSRR